MPVPSSINDLSPVAGSNSPAGSESPGLIDDYLRAISSFIAQMRDSAQPLNVQKFTTPGTFTYTPTTGTKKIIVKVQGAGGGGGGAQQTVAGAASAGCGGSAGGYAESLLTSGFSGQTITVGTGGAGVLTAAGSNGTSSSFGALLSGSGGVGGDYQVPVASYPVQLTAPVGGTGTGGNIFNGKGGDGERVLLTASGNGISGRGGRSMFSEGGSSRVGAAFTGNAGLLGSGGGGAITQSTAGTNYAGGKGGDGAVIIEEYGNA